MPLTRFDRRRRTIKPLSFSRVSDYLRCPLYYRLRYVDGLKPKDRWYLSFGSTLHLCAEHFFRVSAPPPSPMETLLEFYRANWIPDGYESGDEELKYRAYGEAILKDFWGLHARDFRVPVAVEKHFLIDIDGVKFTGRIDRVDRLPGGGLGIVDYKTNRELFTSDYLAKDLQLSLYQSAVQEMWRLPVASLTLYHLRSNTPCTCPPRDRAEIESARALVAEVAGKIAAGRFPATEREYCPCDFARLCPYHSDRYEPPTQPALPGFSAVEMVESYVSLQKQIKELEAKLDEIKAAIIAYCQAQGVQRVYGEKHAVPDGGKDELR
ncbi:MAG: PD-(D/E)XK nuclease family protein [Chloroflexi bacterium]|nr:PD-(D/E)XK nuclease family protein [Chloroflexota bacterium]